MAEAVVSSVLNSLTTLQGPADRGPHVRKLDREILKIRSKLEGVSSLLPDAETKADKDEAVKLWIGKLSKTCYDAEDILDVTEVLHSHIDLNQLRPRRHGFSGFLKEPVRFLHDLAVSQKLASQMAEIRARLDQISETGCNFNLHRTNNSADVDVPITFRRNAVAGGGDDDGIVGAEKAEGYLIDWLLDKKSQLTTVSVVGMGGCGKTTLAKRVYNSHNVRNHFDCQAWITVAQDFKIQTVLHHLLEQLSPEEDTWSSSSPPSTRELGKALAACLEMHRYLIVLDDVWSTDVWKGVRNVLPDLHMGSRVLITTRVPDVALSTYGRVYDLQFLRAEESWRLFCKKAFPPTGDCPQELMVKAQEIVKRCGGLPLAITVVGTLLSSKKRDIAAWEAFAKSFSSRMEANPYFKTQDRALKLSYHDLPFHIRSCFLYLSLFPGDAPIRFSKLARLWAAEGLLQTTTSSEYSEEEAAQECVSALVHRSLVQVSETYDDGRVRSCQVHDIVHDMIRSIAKELNFAAAAATTKRSARDVRSLHDVRRISISNKNDLDDVSQDIELGHFDGIRSLLISGPFRSLDRSLKLAMPSLRVLRVLVLEGTNLKSFPTGIENLILLRYLSFRDTGITALPRSVGKLAKLETLDLKGTQLTSLPDQIAKLKALRHLLVGGSRGKKWVLIPPGMGGLTALRTLKYIHIAHRQTLASELGELKQMRSLCLTNLKKGDGSILLSSVQQMPHLVSFKAISEGDGGSLDVDAPSSPPLLSLQRLHLKGFMELEKLPTWIASSKGLVKIHLEGSGLVEDPFRVLKSLPRMTALSLVEAYNGEQLCCDDPQGFPELKVLNLTGLHELQSLQIKQGAMRCLQELQFDNCSKLWALPADIKHLSQLRHLHVINAPGELVENIESYKQKGDTIVHKIIVKPANRSVSQS